GQLDHRIDVLPSELSHQSNLINEFAHTDRATNGSGRARPRKTVQILVNEVNRVLAGPRSDRPAKCFAPLGAVALVVERAEVGKLLARCEDVSFQQLVVATPLVRDVQHADGSNQHPGYVTSRVEPTGVDEFEFRPLEDPTRYPVFFTVVCVGEVVETVEFDD